MSEEEFLSDADENGEGTLINKFVRGEVDFGEVFKLENELAEASDDEQQPYSSRPSVAPNLEVDEVFDGRSRPGAGPMRKRSVLNAALMGLMGEANLRFARGQIEMAEKICLEIIRQNPFAPEPFFTLAEIYENRDKEKYLNFLTIAAHLNPQDRDQWIRIAEMHVSKGADQLARIYYTKAIKALPKDYDLRMRKASLLEKMGDSKSAMYTYLKMIPHVPAERSELCLVTAKMVARHYHGLGKTNFALEAMESAYNTCSQLFSLEDLNLYMELLILNKTYDKVIRCLLRCTKFEMDASKEIDQAAYCIIPDDFLPDFRAKLAISLIHLRAFRLIGYLISNIKERIPLLDERLDLYIDVAEALMAQKRFEDALDLLRPITDGTVIDCPPFVWLRHSECLRNLNRCNDAIEALQRVVDMAPFCYEAKFTLSSLLKQQGRNVEAARALEEPVGSEGQPFNPRLLYERCMMLRQIGEIDEFLDMGYVLLARNSVKLRNREEVIAAASGGNFYHADGLKVILQMRNITEDTESVLDEYNRSNQEQTDLTIHEEYHLFLDLVSLGFVHRKYSMIERICFAMVTTKRFVAYHVELEPIIILACYYNNDCEIAFSYMRELMTKNPHNVAFWNMLSLFVQKGQDLRYNRYLRRLVDKTPSARLLRIFMAHYHLNSSSYKYALNIYVPMLKEHKLPLIALCIAVVFNQLSMQKKVLRKPAAVAQSIAFAHHYAELRTGGQRLEDKEFDNSAASQEIYYNIGRIYHQAGIMNQAIHYYTKALEAKHPLIDAHQSQFDLRPEIAFNMHLIYRMSGNFAKARQYLYQYCVV